jgi:hypothetical protein
MVTFSLEINYTIRNHKANSINEKEKKFSFICRWCYREITVSSIQKKQLYPNLKEIAAFILKLAGIKVVLVKIAADFLITNFARVSVAK